MQPEDEESPVQVTVLRREGEGERPLGSGILVSPLVVLADERLSAELYSRQDLFPTGSDDLKVLFPRPGAPEVDPEALLESEPVALDPDAPVFFVELVDGGRRERIEVCELYRSLGTPRPWVGFGLAQESELRPDAVPAEATEGLVVDPERRTNWVCLLMPKACRR